LRQRQNRSTRVAEAGTNLDEGELCVRVSDIDTPAIIVDLDIVERNLRTWQQYCDQHEIANRPHIKTHKLPELARLQLQLGAVGITCQKLGEAEIMAQVADDILITYNIVGEAKLRRLIDLARQIRLSVTADHPSVVQGLSDAMRNETQPLRVLVECDTGFGRCGVQTPTQALDLAKRIADSPGLRFGGLMTFPTSIPRGADFMSEAVGLIQQAGLPVPVVSGGGTPQMWEAHKAKIFNEHRAGTYVYNDRHTVEKNAARPDDCALRVLATVISRPTPDRAVLDAGSKALSSDLLGLNGYGLVLGYPQASIVSLSEEHGVVESPDAPLNWDIGQRVEIIPNHVCPVSNLFDQIHVIRQDRVETIWNVAARGRLQ
jgi:D-serine deaminase-like pyridoxal phosphate-dependent protein